MLNADALHQLRQLKTEIKAAKVVLPGTVKATQGRFGFVALDDGRELYLPQEQMQRVLPGDRIQIVEQTDANGKTFAEVDALESSSLTTFVGRYLIKGKGHFVAPDTVGINRWIFIPPKAREGADDGDFIYCRILRHPFKDGKGQAEVIRILGKPEQPGIERAMTLAQFDLDDRWPEAVTAELAVLDESYIEQAAAGREDLTEQPYVTIDNASTQDMDDALLARAVDDGWLLSVAIADPTALIPQDGATERHARQRATSIYFPGEPMPMLPEQVSTRLCSLMPDARRLAVVCDIQVNSDGSLGNASLRQAVIRSHAKLSYDLVASRLAGQSNDEYEALPEAVRDNLTQLQAVTRQLRQWRQEHALLSPERAEYRLRLDENKRIRSIEPSEQNDAHRLVEDCMVAANRSVANLLANHQAQVKGLYIQHPGIREGRQDNIAALLKAHAPDLAGNAIASLEGFRTLMQQAGSVTADVPVKAIISRQLARSEPAAEPAPHQGMGLERYTTFTSPLRKYHDFHVHRLVKHLLWGEPLALKSDALVDDLQQRQLLARQAANSLEQWLRCDYAVTLDKTSVRPGVISRTTSAGFFVQLLESGLEGFVSSKSLGEKYSFDPVTLQLKSKTATYQLEQPVAVRLEGVDQERRQINFNLVLPATTAP
ncbi:MAG: VacB/RNase II family 3'-5' exoribonuclease [Marinobacter sp.]|nr:VacB/RNase II family 3'-5' exoribonuclease [Marinobacter sp.]